jgi:hypothetical protein
MLACGQKNIISCIVEYLFGHPIHYKNFYKESQQKRQYKIQELINILSSPKVKMNSIVKRLINFTNNILNSGPIF